MHLLRKTTCEAIIEKKKITLISLNKSFLCTFQKYPAMAAVE